MTKQVFSWPQSSSRQKTKQRLLSEAKLGDEAKVQAAFDVYCEILDFRAVDIYEEHFCEARPRPLPHMFLWSLLKSKTAS